MKTIHCILTICFSFLLHGCFLTGSGNNCRPYYELSIPLSINPSEKTLKVGDTLSIKMDIDNSIIADNFVDNRTVNIPSFDPKVDFFMPMLDSFPIIDGLDSVLVIGHEGTDVIINNGTELSDFISVVKINSSETSSSFNFDIILNRKGTYALYSYSVLKEWDEGRYINFEGRCGDPRFDGGSLEAVFDINDGEINLDFLSLANLENENKYWQDYNDGRDRARGYYFRVE